MRIAMLASSDAYWTPLYARHFAAAGHAVRILSLTATPLDAPDLDLVHVCAAKPSRVPAPLWFVAQVPRVRQLLRDYAPDVVFAAYMSSNGVTAALAWRGPLVVSGHGGDVLRQAGYLPGGRWLHRRMMRLQAGRAQVVHVVADEMVEVLAAYGIPRGIIVRFPLGVDVEAFAPCPPAPADAIARIVCTRRQEPVYANDVIVDALGMLRARGVEAHCTFVGGGPLLDERRAQVNARGLDDRVTFTGQVPVDTVRALLRSAHVYVSASTSDGASSSLLEAMLCGAFPVVSRIPANEPWICEGRTGLAFDAGDAVGLAAALERAIRDPALRHSAAATNRALVVREGNLRVSMARTLGLLDRARRAVAPHGAQGILRNTSTSKNGAVTGGVAVSRPVGTGGAVERIGMSSAPPA